MFLPLFLALDRFVAVIYPHKMKNMLRLLRPFKVVCVAQCFLQVAVFMAIEILMGTETMWFKVAVSVTLLAINTAIFTALVLYVIIAVKVVISSKRMKKHKSATAENRLE